MGGWMDGWMNGWVGGSKSRFKDCLPQLKIKNKVSKKCLRSWLTIFRETRLILGNFILVWNWSDWFEFGFKIKLLLHLLHKNERTWRFFPNFEICCNWQSIFTRQFQTKALFGRFFLQFMQIIFVYPPHFVNFILQTGKNYKY